MRLYMKQKLFSWGDKFSIYDERGNERYFVRGEVFSLGKKLHVYSAGGTEVILIKRKIWSFLPRFSISIMAKKAGTVIKHFSLTQQRYTIEGLNYSVTGDFLAHDYMVYDRALPVAIIKKAWLTWADTYEIDIADYADEFDVISIVLAIDASLDERG